MSKRRKKKRSSKTKRWGIIFGIELVLILILIPVVFVYAKLSLIQTASASDVDKANIVINNDVDATTQKALKGYRNIALFGVDSRDGSLQTGARSDSIMVISINQETKDVKITSIYRDTCLKVPGYGFSKATHAYAYGGAELSMSMLNTNLDLDITEYVTVGFDALIETIDELGGIDIDVHDNEIDHLNNYQRSMFVENENDALNENIVKVTHSGMQTLNGLQATAYCRIRYVGDDFGRAERQRKVLMACMDKAKTMSPTTLVSILNKVMENVYTNLDVTEMASILSDVANYQIVAQDGVPFEDSRTTGTIGKKGSCVIPLDLETNVVKLHELMFDVTEYEPSDQVKQYSQKVQADTSQYMKK